MTEAAWQERAERAEAELSRIRQFGSVVPDLAATMASEHKQAFDSLAMCYRMAVERCDELKHAKRRAEAQVAALRRGLFCQATGLPCEREQAQRQQAYDAGHWNRALCPCSACMAWTDTAATAAQHDAAVRRAAMERCAQIAEHTPCGSLSAEFVRDTIAAAIRAETEKA